MKVKDYIEMFRQMNPEADVYFDIGCCEEDSTKYARAYLAQDELFNDKFGLVGDPSMGFEPYEGCEWDYPLRFMVEDKKEYEQIVTICLRNKDVDKMDEQELKRIYEKRLSEKRGAHVGQ